MTMIKNALRKILTGFLYGIGFSVVAGVSYYYLTEKMMEAVWNDQAFDKVIITNHEKTKRNEKVLILGTVENKGSEPVRTLSLQVDLFDKNGKFVGQCSEYLKGAIKPGVARNFKVSCGGCKDNPVVEHESYKVYVVSL